MATQGDRIHDAIHGAISGWSFPLVTYDPDTGLRTTADIGTESPDTLLVRDITSSFDAAVGFRRQPRVRERIDWTWEATLAFDNQVAIEDFEEFYTQAPLFLARTVDFDQQVTITLDQAEYTHPTEQQSSSGTRATLTFTASLSRK